MLTYAKYPYLADLPGYLTRTLGYQVTVKDLVEDKRVLERARRMIREAVEKAEIGPPEGSVEEEVASFYLASAIVASADSTRLTEVFAEAEARRSRKFLDDEDKETLIAIARTLGLKASTTDVRIPWVVRAGRVLYKTYGFSVGLADYLRVTAGLNDPRWFLVNSMVKGGLVYLDDKGFRDYLSLAVYRRVRQMVSSAPKDEALRVFAEDALRALEAKAAKIPISHKLNVELFPPCMRELAQSPASKGDKGLYAYLSFLASIGVPIEVIASELSKGLRAPEDRSKALAAALLRAGLGSKYKPYTCEVMKSEGLCPADCGARTPLEAYKRAVRRSSAGSQGPREAEKASQASPIRS
ncbi:MAG: hypothetical protein ACP5FT_02540 [Acidilobus sp.]